MAFSKDSDIEAYKCTLNNCLPLYSLNACILNSTLPCSCIVPHMDAINSFHDHLIKSCKIAMSVHIPYTNSGVCKAKVIPGWDYEADCAREESLLARRIWIESGKPDAGIEYDNMKRCRASYHYLLRSLKSKKIFMLNNRCFSPAKGIIGKVLLLFTRRITILFQLLIILEVMTPLLNVLKINMLHYIIVFLLLAIQ